MLVMINTLIESSGNYQKSHLKKKKALQGGCYSAEDYVLVTKELATF